MGIKPLVLSVVLALFNTLANAGGTKTILLDPGHSPEAQGALGVKGQYEVVYNDSFSAKLASQLQLAGYQVVLTRQPHQHITLMDRVKLANEMMPTLFLSIHHDSAQLLYLDKITTKEGKLAYQTKKPISGYSLFVSQLNIKSRESQLLAESLSAQLLQLKRPPTLHHAEPIKGENRTLLNEALGVYRYDDLAVLKHTKMPAVLFEVGVIVDAQDEAYVVNAKHQQDMIDAIIKGIEHFLSLP